MEELKNKIKELGLLPINFESQNKILVVDIMVLPSKYKEVGDLDAIREKLESEYECKVLLVDTLKVNSGCSYGIKPVFFA